MAPPKRPWFRFYTEALTDPKLRRLTPEERWLYVAVLGAARQSSRPGWLMLTDSLPFEHEDLAELAGMTVAKVVKGTDKMQDLGLIGYEDKTWFVPSWDARQFESDKVTERVAKHRSSNADVTANRRRKADDVTPPETETENRDRSRTKDDDDDFQSVEPPISSSSSQAVPAFEMWIRYAELVADSQAEPPKNRSAFVTKVAQKARRERHRRLAEYLEVCPSASTETLARWLYDDIDPVTIDRPEDDPDFTPADRLTVIDGAA